MKMSEIARILEQQLGEDARKVSTRVLPDLLVRFAALFCPLVKAVVGALGSNETRASAIRSGRPGRRS